MVNLLWTIFSLITPKSIHHHSISKGDLSPRRTIHWEVDPFASFHGQGYISNNHIDSFARPSSSPVQRKAMQSNNQNIPVNPTTTPKSSTTSTTTTTTKSTKKKVKKLFPGLEKTIGLGLSDRWQEVEGGGYLLYPPEHVPPVAIIHFIGDAFVGSAPQVTYRYLLDLLSLQGFLIVTTPYKLDVDYVRICDTILLSFEEIYNKNLTTYHHLPIIGVGHGCGAVLHSLVSSLFPDYPKAANILLAYSTQPISHIIPAFDELFVPLFKQLAHLTSHPHLLSSKVIQEMVRYSQRYLNIAYELYASSQLSPAFITDEVVPLIQQGVGMLDQVPPLVQVLASSSSTTSNFSPTPLHTKEVLRLMYRCPQTFIVAFAGDAFAKESLSLVQLLQEANTLFKMKKSNRPRQDMIVSHLILPGGRMTPCSQSIFVDLLKLFPLYNNSSTSVTGKTPKIADDRKQANSNSSQSVLEQILKFLPETYDRLVQTFDTSYLSQVEAVADQLGLFMNDIASAVPGSLEERKEEIAAWQAATREAVQERLTKLKAARIERTTSALQSQQSSPATASTNAVASRSVSSSRSSTLSSPPLAVIQDVPGDEVGLREALGESKASSRPVKKTKKQKKRDSTFSSMLLRAHAASTSGLQKAQSSLTAALVLLAGFAQLALLQVASVATWVGQIIMEKLQPSFANLASFSKEFLKESSGKTWQFLSAQESIRVVESSALAALDNGNTGKYTAAFDNRLHSFDDREISQSFQLLSQAKETITTNTTNIVSNSKGASGASASLVSSSNHHLPAASGASAGAAVPLTTTTTATIATVNPNHGLIELFRQSQLTSSSSSTSLTSSSSEKQTNIATFQTFLEKEGIQSQELTLEEYKTTVRAIGEKIDRRIYSIGMSFLFNGLSVGIIIPCMPLLSAQLQLPPSDMGIIVSAFGLSKLLGNMPSAHLVERFGRKVAIESGMIVTGLGVGCIGLALLPGFGANWLITCRLLSGLGVSSFLAGGFMFLSDISTTLNRTRTMAPAMAAFHAGCALGPALGGVLADRLGLPYTYGLVGLMFFGNAVHNWLTMVETHPASSLTHGDQEKANSLGDKIRKEFNTWGSLLQNGELRDMIVLNGAFWFAWSGAQMTLLPLFLVSNPIYSLTPTELGAYFAASSVVSFLSAQPVAYVADRFSKPAVLLTGLVPLAIGSTMLNALPTSMVTDLSSDSQRAQALSLLRTAGDVGLLVGAASAGFLATHSSLGTAFATDGGILLSVMVAYGYSCYRRYRKLL
eukprot:gene7980-8802_t